MCVFASEQVVLSVLFQCCSASRKKQTVHYAMKLQQKRELCQAKVIQASGWNSIDRQTDGQKKRIVLIGDDD